MKIIHSFWSRPSLAKFNDFEKVDGGWINAKYHLMSWALSCLLVKRHYEEIELVTDNHGAKLLIDSLDLPYTKINLTLDNINKYSPKLWALGKIHAYLDQKDPFIHIDGDVFIWEKFSNEIENGKLIAQNVDLYNLKEYYNALIYLKAQGFVLPAELDGIKNLRDLSYSYNAGIIGGNDIDFIHYFSKRSLAFIEQNVNKINPEFQESSFAIIYEQLLFAFLAKERKVPVTVLFKGLTEEFKNLSDFQNRLRQIKYVHIMNISKMQYHICHELEMQLMTQFPNYYDKILRFIKVHYG